MNIHGQDRQIALDAFEDAAISVSRGEAVDVGRVLQESQALNALYEQALFNPLLAQDPHSPQVRLMYRQLADELGVNLGDIFVDIGNAELRADGSIHVKTKFGMIKFVWKHGEKGSKPLERQVTKEDILAFPRILREFLPEWQEKQQSYAWVVQREDGQFVLYAAKNFTETTGESHLVSMYILNENQAARTSLSQKKKALTSPDGGSGPPSGIPHGELPKPRSSVGPRAIKDNISSGSEQVNPFAVETPETFAPAHPLGEVSEARLEDLGIDRQSGLSSEEILARDLAAEGRIPEEHMAGLEEALDAEARLKQVEEGGNQILECILEAID
jgi:hypothetical protein